MKISAITNFRPLINTYGVQQNSYVSSFNSTPLKDTFERSNSNVSFGKDNDFLGDVAAFALVAAVLSVPTLCAISMAKHPPKDIFLSDGTYIGNVNDMRSGIDTEVAKESGIDLSDDRFLFKDPINGVFKNPEKGIDINFTSGKYVDPENGIFIDPEAGVSAVYNNGHFDPVVIPNIVFKGHFDPSMPSGGPHFYTPAYQSREDFIKEHDGQTPEEFYDGIEQRDPRLGFLPIDRRSLWQKGVDWFKNTDSMPEHDYWGREIVNVQDSAGIIHKVPLSDKLSEIMHDRHMSYEDVQEFITYQAENPIAGYIAKNMPQNLHNFNFDAANVEEFVSQAEAHSHDVHFTSAGNSGDDVDTDNALHEYDDTESEEDIDGLL